MAHDTAFFAIFDKCQRLENDLNCGKQGAENAQRSAQRKEPLPVGAGCGIDGAWWWGWGWGFHFHQYRIPHTEWQGKTWKYAVA